MTLSEAFAIMKKGGFRRDIFGGVYRDATIKKTSEEIQAIEFLKGQGYTFFS